MNEEREKQLKFYMAAKTVWDELGLEKKLDGFFSVKDMMDRNPFNPDFVIEKIFYEELFARGIIEKTAENNRLVAAFLMSKYIPRYLESISKAKPQHQNEDPDCNGDCRNCAKGKALIERFEKEETSKEQSNAENPGGMWN